MVQPVTDPELLQQLEGGAATPVDQATAAKLDSAGQNPFLNSPLGGFVRGLRDPVDAGAQLLARGLAAAAPAGSGFENWAKNQAKTVDDVNRAAEADYTENWRGGAPPSFDVGRIAGNVAATAPMASFVPGIAAPSLLARMGAGAVVGGASGALQPVSPDSADFWGDKAHQAEGGAAFGAAAQPIFGALARGIQPNVSPEVQLLMDSGVRPTPGQVMGGMGNRVEQGLTSIPGLGDFIKNGQRGAIVDFNRGAINQALAPLGETLESSGMGRDAIAEMQSKIGAAYDRIVPKLGISAVDETGAPSVAATQLNADLGKLLSASRLMPPERASQLRSILQSEVYDKLSPAGGMTGESFQEAKSALGRLSTEYLNSSSADERQLGGALMQAQVALRTALRLGNPEAATELGAADSAFAHMLRIQNAAVRPGAEPGMFSPAQLQAATKSLDPSLRNRAFAAGDALMQNYAEAGKSVLGNTVPDSGTPYRGALIGLGLAGAGHGLGASPEVALGLAGGTGLAGLAYSPAGRAALSALLARRPAIAAPAAAMVRRASPVASTIPAAFGALGF